jgi:HlyD family secretion protein
VRVVPSIAVLAAVAGVVVAIRGFGGVAAVAPGDPGAPTTSGQSPPAARGPLRVTALGRIGPRNGLIRVAGPSQPTAVIARLLVDEGDHVEAGQVIAILDSFESLKAEVARLAAELANARNELERHQRLYSDEVVSVSEHERWRMKVAILEARLHGARIELEKASVRSPITGQVVDVHARPGERVGEDGICELAETDRMIATAEVYETDIARVRVGQRAVVSSPALDGPLAGTVERIGWKVGKLDVLGVDPVARTDARVVEVEIRLDDGRRVAALTNLQVEVAIIP